MGNICSEGTKSSDDTNEKRNQYQQSIPATPSEILKEEPPALTGNFENDLKLVKSRYNNYKELLKREWVINSELEKEYKDNNGVEFKLPIKIMQFNILADGLSGVLLDEETDKTFLNVDKKCLHWDYRGLRLLEEITRYQPDIICLQECDKLDFLQRYLEPLQYKCYFQEKDPSPTKDVAEDVKKEKNIDVVLPPDGIAIIYNANKFNIIDNASIQQIKMPSNKEKVIGLVVPLQYTLLPSKPKFLLVNTHLKSTKTQEGEEKRVRQIRLLINELVSNPNNLPLVLCCDLNATPDKNKKGYDPLCYEEITKNLNFRSLYAEALGGKEPEYTTWKLRKHGQDKQVLDYIFYKGGNWKIKSHLSIPEATNDIKSLIPGWEYPSDHFSLVIELVWKEQINN